MPDDDLTARVAAALRDHAAPALDLDGTRIEVVSVADGVAAVRLAGACAGCPASVHAILFGLEQEVRRHVPEVEFLEAVP